MSSYLLPHTDVSLLDEDPGVVDRLGKPQLEHLKKYIMKNKYNKTQYFNALSAL